MNTAIYAILKGCRLVKIMCVVVHTKWITALFLSTIYSITRHHFPNNIGELLFCVPGFLGVRIIFLKHEGSGVAFRCRSPPSDFDFASQL